MRLLMLSSSSLRNAFTTTIVLLNTVLITTLIFTCLSNELDTDRIIQADHSHAQLLELRSEAYGSSFHQEEEEEPQSYEPDFAGLDKSIRGRAQGPGTLQNNVPGSGSIDTAASHFYVFGVKKKLRARQLSQQLSTPSSLAERGPDGTSLVAAGSSNAGQAGLESRQSNDATLYVTLSVCSQPAPISSNSNGAPLPLRLYISNKTTTPTESNHDALVLADGGLGSYNFTASTDVYFGIVAPSQSRNFKGNYSYELTASTDQPYVSYFDDTEMVFVDSDTNSALLFSNPSNITGESAPFSIYVHNQQDSAILGLGKSFCGLQNYAQIKGNINGSATADVDTGMMTLPPDIPTPQQHFYVKTLNGSTAYYGIKVVAGNSANSGTGVPGGGGSVYGMVNFKTKSDGNCAVIFNLTFCSDVAYAVPSNPHTQPNVTTLKTLYDNYAENLYQNFSKSLQQIPCDTTSSAQYSLARNCDNCATAYKTWLCAVTIPRCEDYSNHALYLQPRAVGQNYPNGSAATNLSDPTFSASNKTARYMNSSRNPMIDWKIIPGPYKEILPCADICYEVVRSCPANLEFACPLKHHGLNYTYGFNSTDSLSCNFPGAVAGQTGAAAGLRGNQWIMTTALLAGLIVGL